MGSHQSPSSLPPVKTPFNSDNPREFSLSFSTYTHPNADSPLPQHRLTAKSASFFMEINGGCDEVWGSRLGGEMKGAEVKRRRKGEMWRVEGEERKEKGGERAQKEWKSASVRDVVVERRQR